VSAFCGNLSPDVLHEHALGRSPHDSTAGCGAVDVACPAGTIVSAGGYAASGPELRVQESRAYADSSGRPVGWEVSALNLDPSSAHTLEVHALCLSATTPSANH
jgi:hypothetical protein